DALIQECNAKENTSSSSPTGYGGGIFLTGSGDYDSSTNRLDLRGMAIFENIAEIAGQSLYVAMTQLAECNNAFEVIYPPEDGSSEPILVQGDLQSQQTASFGTKDISWMDYKNKKYGIFASNDRRIFTGVGGKQDEAYPLEIIIEEDGVKTTQFPWWFILILALSSITFITLKTKQK
ncbi:MAG: hypothetical protein EZS28_017622, partial [Streblomastix strix]